MENPAEDWELLVDGFLEYRRRGVTGSGIAGMHTSKGRENMTRVLKHMVQNINGPIIIAWDAEKQKVIPDNCFLTPVILNFIVMTVLGKITLSK